MTNAKQEKREKAAAPVPGGVTVIDPDHPDGKYDRPKPPEDRNMLTGERETARAKAAADATPAAKATKATKAAAGKSGAANKGDDR